MYLPPENIQLFNKEVADFFIRKALKERDDRKLQMFCIDKAFGFLYDEENLKMAASWVTVGKIHILGESLDIDLTLDQRLAFIKNYYAAPFFDTDTKKEMKELIFAHDDSDKGKNIQMLCDQSLPDVE